MLRNATPTSAAPAAPCHKGRVLFVLLGVVCLAVVGVWFGMRRAAANNWGVVKEGKIYRSGQLSDNVLRDVVAKDKISVIISLSSDKSEGPEAQAESRIAQDMGIQRYNLPLNGDGIGDPGMYAQAMQIISQANRDGKAVLVHCHSGAQRTGGVIAAYQVLVENKSPQEVYAQMLSHGYDPHGNAGLIPFLNQNMAAWAQALVQMKVIEHAPDPVPRFTP